MPIYKGSTNQGLIYKGNSVITNVYKGNTLVYRLDKIKKLTGLDLREFDHAIIFKIALMVKKYLAANPTKY